MTGTSTDIGKPVQLRKMVLSDMDSLMELKNAEGWNQLEKDWTLLINYKESVNLVAVLDKRVVGSVTAINYADTVAWIGMMLVAKDYRGRGIGKLLMLDAIDKLKKCESIKLDATPAGRPVYLKLGFIDEYKLYRMTNPSGSKTPQSENQIVTEKIGPGDIPNVAAFDKKVFGADRTELIRQLYEGCPELAWLSKAYGRVAGFCLGRPGRNFTQIGPLNASSREHAEALIGSAINQMTGRALVVDIPAERSDTRQWLEGCGFETQRPFDRMYLHNNPHPGIIANQYLIAGPELG